MEQETNQFGMAAGCIPVVGFNMGAGKKDRVKELFTKLLIAEAAVGLISLLIVELLPQQLINIFGAANYLNANNDYALSYYISNQGSGFIPRGKELLTATGDDIHLKDIEFSFFAYIQNNDYTSQGVNICLGEILCEQPASIPNN